MKDYDTLTEALIDLHNRGYREDFNLQNDRQDCPARELESHPEDFEVDEFYRFEGQTDPADSVVLNAISSKNRMSGTILNAYGAYAENLTPPMVQKLHIKGR